MLRTLPMSHNSEKAFTLAEVLITLMIIGILALLTLPQLIQSWQDIGYKTAYRNAYSDVNQAFQMAMVKEEILNNIPLYDERHGENFKALSKQFKTVKTCFASNIKECWECANGEAGVDSPPSYLGCHSTGYSFMDNTGRSWSSFTKSENVFLMDTNSFKPPNKLGKDRFVFSFRSKDNQRYSTIYNHIEPNNDMLSPGRWCPSGNCKYRTGLY